MCNIQFTHFSHLSFMSYYRYSLHTHINLCTVYQLSVHILFILFCISFSSVLLYVDWYSVSTRRLCKKSQISCVCKHSKQVLNLHKEMLLNVYVGNGWYIMILSINLSLRYMCVPFSCLHGFVIWLQKQEVVKTTDASALQHVPPSQEIQFTRMNFCESLCLTFKNTLTY